MEQELFGIDKNGNEIYRYTLHDGDSSVSILNYGATIQSLKIKNAHQELVDVILGFDTLQEYEKEEGRPYFGCVCGRVANRIEKGAFYIEAKEYALFKNDKGNSLHGGKDGLDKKYFELTAQQNNALEFTCISLDGEEGYPGNLLLKVRYTFSKGLLLIEYFATVSKTCPIALTNHSYFNLDRAGDIQSHTLQLCSDYYLQIDDNGLAKGQLVATANTCMDFSKPMILKGAIQQLKQERPTIKGIDHYFFCNNKTTEYRKVATLQNSDNSLGMDIFTNQPGMQIYTGNFLEKGQAKERAILQHGGVAFETQFPPNAMPYAHLPSMLLKPNQQYYHKTGYRFFTEDTF